MNPYADVLDEAHAFAKQYLARIDERGVAPSEAAVRGLARFDEALPDRPGAPEATVALLNAAGGPATMATQSGRFFGLVVGGALPVTVGAQWLAVAWDQLAFNDTTSPVAIKLESVAARWVLELLRLPQESSVSFVTGTTMAHFTCLSAARAALLLRQGYDVRRQGLRGAPRVRFVVSGDIHVSVLKALAMMGVGEGDIERAPADDQGRIIAATLPPLDPATIVICQVGNVNSGAFDPIPAICDAAEAAGAWVHVDGAFGLWSRATPTLDALSQGLERAHSWTTDGHKWLNTPWECGLAICRDPKAVAAVLRTDAAYLQIGQEIAPKDMVPEFGRRARGIEIWAALRSLGRAGVADLVERCCAHARRFAEGFRAMGLEVLNDVVLNQVVVAAATPAETARLIAEVQRSGECWFGPTTWQGREGFRISVSSWRTTPEDVERSLAAVAAAKARLAARQPA